MKKGVIALILFLVLVIIVSPGIVGKMAEQSVDDNLSRAVDDSGELVVTSQSFDRGWFSSEGQHRIELGDGEIRAALVTVQGAAAADDVPVLIINTRIDHGLIPVSSMSRDKGSLAPGLGSAVSTMVVEYGNGETFEVPGKIFSELGLGGDLDSRYELEAGSKQVDNGEVSWEATTINVTADNSDNEIEFDGTVGALSFGDQQQMVTIDGVTFEGTQIATPYGFSVGDIDLVVEPMNINSGGLEIGGNKGVKISATSELDDDSVSGDMHMELNAQSIPGFGDISIISDASFSGFNAAAVQALNSTLDNMPAGADPTVALMSSEEELKSLFASGLDFSVEKLEIGLPMGTVESALTFAVPESDSDDFRWTSLLQSTEATLDLKVPEVLIQMASSLDPQVSAIVGMGYLKKNGDYYEMDADYKKGLLTVNGAPIPIPLGAFQ